MRPTAALLGRPYRKLRLTTKDINKGFYKGNRTGSMGTHTKWGGYKIDYDKVRTYVVPENLNEFTLTPFVSQKIRPKWGDYSEATDKMGPRSPALYLKRWKEENGYD
ncbi:uncharacterized protein MKZ38_001714 [Zalerion maritima]|uniref:Uncharacterized protein n=1 Tax=Zalerion maritima TaxID=339359 RepID=A0AAD5RQV7_9PEZI|nr:uncharacterized protein MKZ38_001714 [Zalerion maritima]